MNKQTHNKLTRHKISRVTHSMMFCLFGLLCFQTIANPVALEVNLDNATLELKTTTCLYGRGIQPAIQQSTLQHFQRYITTQISEIVETIKATSLKASSITPKHFQADLFTPLHDQQQVSHLLQLGLNPKQIQHQYFLQGTDTCSHAATTINLAQLTPNQLFKFQKNEQLHLVTEANNIERLVRKRLLSSNIDYNKGLVGKHLHSQYSFIQNDSPVNYYQFNLQQYTDELQRLNKRVYVFGTEPYVGYLQHYLTEQGYTVLTHKPAPNAEVAIHHVQISGHIIDNNYLKLQLNINNRQQVQLTLNNNPMALPAIDMSQAAAQQKFSQVHFELLQLTKHFD